MLERGDLEPSLRDRLGSLRLAVVGHVEWAEFLRVPRLPAAGEILHVSDQWEAPAGGGAVTAVQLARLAGHATLFAALGDDELGHRAADELEAPRPRRPRNLPRGPAAAAGHRPSRARPVSGLSP